MRRALRVSAAIAFVVAVSSPRVARATSVEEFPDNGSEQEGRGGAWVARASDPLAAFYNPAGLAGQPTRLTLQANISTQHTCFTRVKATNDTTSDGVAPGASYPKVCNAGSFFPDPQIAFTYHLSDRVGLGIALLGPSAVGSVSWPDFQGTTPSPQRYLLISTNSVLLLPTVGVGWEALDRLRIGASFIFGTAPSLDFINAAPATTGMGATPSNNDIRNELKAKDLFFPGFTLGAIWSPVDNLDVAGWFKWVDNISAKGDVRTEANAFSAAAANGDASQIVYGDTSQPYCYTLPASGPPAGAKPVCGNGNNASITVPIPMEAKLGVRYHKPRADVPYDEHRRDPIAQDVFDLEADFTWANNSAFDSLQIRFPADPTSGLGLLPANPGIPGASLPPNADVKHAFRDVFGVRIGGDYNVLPDQLALRAGGFFETQAANSVYQNIDFDGAMRFGFALGGTYRIHVGPADKGRAIELMAGYGHVFFGTLDNNNPNSAGVSGLTGAPCATGVPNSAGVCPDGTPRYRTPWPVNLGTITSSINVINVGAAYKF